MLAFLHHSTSICVWPEVSIRVSGDRRGMLAASGKLSPQPSHVGDIMVYICIYIYIQKSIIYMVV